jgi:hypothetical protein
MVPNYSALRKRKLDSLRDNLCAGGLRITFVIAV